MITKWDIISRIEPTTHAILYTLYINGTQNDARLVARKLKGYVKNVFPTQKPYSHALELPSDMDDLTLEKIRQAVREGIALAGKVDNFVPGGAIGDPLFNMKSPTFNNSYPTFLTVLNTANPFNPSLGGQQAAPQLDLSFVTQLGIQDTKPSARVPNPPTQTNSNSIPQGLSQTAREVFFDMQPSQPTADSFSQQTILPPAQDEPIIEQQTLLTPEQPSPLENLPQKMQEPTVLPPQELPAQQAQPAAAPQSPAQLGPQTQPPANSTISINENDMLIKDMEGSLLEKMPLEDILSAETKYDMFIDVATPQPQAQQQKEEKMQAAQPAPQDTFNVFESHLEETSVNPSVEEVQTITDRLTTKNRDFMEENNQQQPAQAPSQPNTAAQANQPAPATQLETADLPEITIRSQEFVQPAAASNTDEPPHTKTILRLKKPTMSGPVPPAPQPPQADPAKTTFRIRRKVTPAPASVPADNPQATIAQPLRSTRTPEHVADQARVAKGNAIDHSIQIPTTELKKHNWPLEVPLVPTYTLNNMVMSVNRFAHATAISVVDNPGKLYNPFVLHGGSGTGKTHFLNALAFSFSKKFGQEQIFMTNGVRLSRGIQRYVMEGTIEKFQNFMQSVKVLLIDDIHLLAINEQNRVFISDLLNSFKRDQKQIVITSKYPPESLGKLEELIQFKLDSGWISELKPASGNTHFRIVKKMLLENGVDLNDKQIESFFGSSHMTLGTITRSIRRLKVLDTLLPASIPAEQRAPAVILEKLLATKGEDNSSKILTTDPMSITAMPTMQNIEWGRIGFFYPQNCSEMMNWMVYALDQRIKELGIQGGFEIVVRSSYATENIISSAFKIANLCDNKKLKGAVILGPTPGSCEPSVRENFYDILTHMLEIMLIRCGVINYEDVRLPSTYVKVISELMR